MLSTFLLPDAEKLQLLEEIYLETGKLILHVAATQESNNGPDCGVKSRRVHSLSPLTKFHRFSLDKLSE